MTIKVHTRLARPAAALIASAGLVFTPVAAANDTAPSSIFAIEQVNDAVSAQISMTGQNNAAVIAQDGAQLEADVVITGNDNNSGVEGESETNLVQQTGSGSTATVSVTGSGNGFVVRQTGDETGQAANNIAELTIAGDANSALLEQTNLLGEDFGNTALVAQYGFGNTARVSQTSSDTVPSAEAILSGVNQISLVQDGVGNLAELDQTGADNLIDLTQSGDNHSATITQTGANLSAIVTQQGEGDVYSLTQTGCAVAACQVVVNRYSPGG